MPRYAFIQDADGWQHDYRFVPQDYVLQPGEQEAFGDKLPQMVDSPAMVREKARRDTLTADVDLQDLVTRLRAATPAQIKTYVQNNVTDLLSAKVLLAKILLILGRIV